MNAFGIAVGVTSLLIIGVFHPIVVKCSIISQIVSGCVFSARCSRTYGVMSQNSAFWYDTRCELLCGLFTNCEANEPKEGWFPSNPKRGR